MKYLCIKTTYSTQDPDVLLWIEGKYYESFKWHAVEERINSECHRKVPLLRFYPGALVEYSPIGLHCIPHLKSILLKITKN